MTNFNEDAQITDREGNERAVEVLESKLRDLNFYVRQGAIDGLIKINSERSIQILFDALNSGDRDLCDRITNSLKRGIGKKQIKLLINILQNGYHRARGVSAEILGEIDDERVIESLILAAQSEVEVHRGSKKQRNLIG